jgi:hypothetical protein
MCFTYVRTSVQNNHQKGEGAVNKQLFFKRRLSLLQRRCKNRTNCYARPEAEPEARGIPQSGNCTIPHNIHSFFRPRETSCRPRTHSHHWHLLEAACFKRPTFTPRTHINHTVQSNPHTTTEATPFAPHSSIPAYISQSADRRQPTYSQNRHTVHCAPTIGGTIQQSREPTAHCSAPLFTLPHLTSSFKNELSGRN